MTSDHVDVLVVGAGLSGISAGCHLSAECPGKSYAILESRSSIGGTWDLFKYPGIRSDSDMFTLGFRFKPWRDAKAIADGPAILEYVRETATEYGVDEHIRFDHKVVSASWSSEDAIWTVEVEHAGETSQMTANFLFACTGYYNYEQGYTPDFAGTERFGGQIVHPQLWSDDIDYEGKRVVVIGSGATAVTLVPAMAGKAEHVTMLQRSPSYIVALPGQDPIADFFRRVLPERAAHAAARWKNVLLTMASFQLSRRRPRLMRKIFTSMVRKQLPEGYPVEKHFTPTYDPWDQRICLVPDADLFKSISKGDASVATDHIETFTERGIQLTSGEHLDADLIITATGLNMLALGGMDLSVDGAAVDLPSTVAYKGLALSGVPNMAVTLGYTNASWTLKCELIHQYVCRLLNYMDEHGYAQATPRYDETGPTDPFIDLTSGYVQRAIAQFPRQGAESPWRAYQNYILDLRLLRRGRVDDGMEFTRARPHVVRPTEPESLAA